MKTWKVKINQLFLNYYQQRLCGWVPRNMIYKPMRWVAIFIMTIFCGTRGWGMSLMDLLLCLTSQRQDNAKGEFRNPSNMLRTRYEFSRRHLVEIFRIYVQRCLCCSTRLAIFYRPGTPPLPSPWSLNNTQDEDWWNYHNFCICIASVADPGNSERARKHAL